MPSSVVALTHSLPSDTLLRKSEIKSPPSVTVSDISNLANRKPLTIDELIRQRSLVTPNEPIVSYPSSGIEYVNYTYALLDLFASRVAQTYRTLIPQRSSSSEPETVVGLLGPSNFEYFISILALTKLGHTVLFLSTRISASAYTSLIETTGARHLLIDKSFQEVAEQVRESAISLQVHNITNMDTYDYPATKDDVDTRFDQNLQPEIESNKISWIIHSSGSTGLPKPIYQTHKAALTNYASNLNLRGFITLPLFHAHGISSVFRAIHSRKQIYMYNANLPLTRQYLLNITQRYDFEILYGVPYALKLLSESLEGIAALSKLKVVMFGGSACPDPLGDMLVENGVNLISHYGTTETGQLMTSFRGPGDKAWDYVRVPEDFKPYISFELRNPGIYELVALEGLPSKVASNRPDGSYATKDLFTPHPTIPYAWKYFARLDDTIVLVNGEKVVPIAFEQLVRNNKYITEAVLFGSGKERVGMIIIPSREAKTLSADAIKKLIFPVLAEANTFMPGYAKLALDMTKILPVGTEYPRTDKGTVIRAAFYRVFEKEIEEIYQTTEVSSGDLCLSESELRAFLRTELSKIVPPSTFNILHDDTDFFSVGIDSLQGIQLRSVLGKNIQTNGLRLASNIVFDFPSISTLAQEMYRLRTGGTLNTVSISEKMEQMVTKYSTFEKHVPMENEKEGQYLVITGATGSLGAHLVSQLILRDDVKKVYCLVRAGSLSNARLRVIQSMRDRSVYHYLPRHARKKIVALPSNFSQASLGLQEDQYNEISSEITGLIHCAWSVNFNLSLGSFEADCISGAHNLINLCLKALRPKPATFNFCSSVSAVAGTKGGFVAEALPASFDCAQNMGYAQSKLVTEQICVNVAKSYGIETRVLRVGQVVADTAHGIWNATEAIPLMLQAGITIGAIPRIDENLLWLPVDIVASGVADISLSTAGPGVMNVVNHRSFHWTRDLLPALHQASLEFSEPSQKEWIELLRNSNQDPIENPPIKLFSFFASKFDNDQPRTSLTYDTSYARFLSPSLAAAPVISQALVTKFIKNFQATSWKIGLPSIPTKRLIVIAGPCGSGKSTVASAASKEFNVPWVEGDNLHSEGSIKKMAASIPLTDDDRWLWLETIKATALLQLSERGCENIIVTCSALKRSYREELRRSKVLKTTFVMLQAEHEVLKHRVAERKGHYMGRDMVEGQVTCLQSPDVDEVDVVPIDMEGEKEATINEVLEILRGIF